MDNLKKLWERLKENTTARQCLCIVAVWLIIVMLYCIMSENPFRAFGHTVTGSLRIDLDGVLVIARWVLLPSLAGIGVLLTVKKLWPAKRPAAPKAPTTHPTSTEEAIARELTLKREKLLKKIPGDLPPYEYEAARVEIFDQIFQEYKQRLRDEAGITIGKPA